MLQSAWARSKTQNLPFTITLGDIPHIPDVCPVLNIPLKKGVGKAHDNSPSLDKIFPALGYVPGNIRIISRRANLIKTNATATELLLVANDLARLEAEFKAPNDLQSSPLSFQEPQVSDHLTDDEELSSERSAIG